MAQTMTQSEMAKRAIARALARGGAAAVTRVRFGLYKVESDSRPGRWHTVSVDAQGRYRCDCPAGIAGRACWHQAATWIAKLEHTAKVRVTGPGTRPPTLPTIRPRPAVSALALGQVA